MLGFLGGLFFLLVCGGWGWFFLFCLKHFITGSWLDKTKSEIRINLPHYANACLLIMGRLNP